MARGHWVIAIVLTLLVVGLLVWGRSCDFGRINRPPDAVGLSVSGLGGEIDALPDGHPAEDVAHVAKPVT